MIGRNETATLGTGGSNGSARGAAIHWQGTTEPQALASPAFCEEASRALDMIEDDLATLDLVLRTIWRGARRGGPVARVAAESIRGLADLAMQKAAIEQEAGL